METRTCLNPHCPKTEEDLRAGGYCHPCYEYKRTHPGMERPRSLILDAESRARRKREAAIVAAQRSKIDMAEARRRDPNLDWFLRHIRKAGQKVNRQAVAA